MEAALLKPVLDAVGRDQESRFAGEEPDCVCSPCIEIPAKWRGVLHTEYPAGLGPDFLPVQRKCRASWEVLMALQSDDKRCSLKKQRIISYF